MFEQLPVGPANPIRFFFEGEEVSAFEGQSLAAALLAAGVRQFRETPAIGAVSGTTRGAPRGPYCMMGVCFDCLVVVDGLPNVQSCMVEAREGMRVARQSGARAPGEAS